MKWTEGHIHLAMRKFLRKEGWQLIAGEFPGGSDHELYPLNVIDPIVACDNSPDPRRHSLGEQIPDLVALRNRDLLICEAKVGYSEADQIKLGLLVGGNRDRLMVALEKHARERGFLELLPLNTLELHPTLVFESSAVAPEASSGFSYLKVTGPENAFFEGYISERVQDAVSN